MVAGGILHSINDQLDLYTLYQQKSVQYQLYRLTKEIENHIIRLYMYKHILGRLGQDSEVVV